MSTQGTTMEKPAAKRRTRRQTPESSLKKLIESLPEQSESGTSEDVAPGTVMVQLDMGLVEDFKAFSQLYNIPCQTLIQQTLVHYVEGEKRLLGKQGLVKGGQIPTTFSQPVPDDDNGYLTLGFQPSRYR